MKTYNHIYQSVTELASFLKQYALEDNEKLLIQVFTSLTEPDAIKQLQVDLQRFFCKSALIGSTSDGNIIDSTVPDQGQTILSFTQFEQTTLSVGFIESTGNSLETGLRLGEQIIGSETKAVISFADGLNCNGEDFLTGLSEVDRTVTLAGGMAGDNGLLKRTFVFDLGHLTDHGAVAVALSNPDLIVRTH